MKNTDFHIPFIHSLVIIGSVTLVAMVSSKYFVEKYMFNNISQPIFTSASPEFSHK